MRITALNVYPVKSCAGTTLEEATLDRRGIVHDREFMLVNANKRFITQREFPRLALVKPVRTESALLLSAPSLEPLRMEPIDGTRFEVSIWRDSVTAADQGDTVAEWLSSYLGEFCRLVRMPDDVVRPVDPDFASRPEDEVGFADGFPILLISEESLADLIPDSRSHCQ